METYKLKQWYPSLDESWKTTHTYEYQRSTGYMCNKSIQHCVVMYKKELHADFWELIEEEKPKPLFITEDDVKLFSETSIEFYIVVNFIKYRSTISDFEDQKKLPHKVFYNESNADEYIWRNKRVFSYEDVLSYHETQMPDVLLDLAKERSKQ